MQQVYLDANATTPCSPTALAAALPYFSEHFGNASSGHGFSTAPTAALALARSQVRALLRAPPESSLIFTSCATESINGVFQGLAHAHPGGHIIVGATEHPAVLACAAWAEARCGASVTRVGPDADGRVAPAAVASAVRANTFLVSIMLANNETGAVTDVAACAAAARAAHGGGALWVHTDASQAVGKMPVDVAALGVDAATVAGHKLYAPKGVGATWLRAGLALPPLLVGGGQEGGARAGTECVPLVVALGAAAAEADGWLAGGGPARAAAARGALAAALRARAAAAGLRTAVNGPLAGAFEAGDALALAREDTPCLPNTLSLSFVGARASALVAALAARGVAVSAGAACHASGLIGGHVLAAMGVPAAQAGGTLRLSLLRDASAEDMDAVAAVVVEEVAVAAAGGAGAATPAAALATDPLFLLDTARTHCSGAAVLAVAQFGVAEGGGARAPFLGGAAAGPPAAVAALPPAIAVVLSATVAHAQGGGQPGDKGVILFRPRAGDEAAGGGWAFVFSNARWGTGAHAEAVLHYGWLLREKEAAALLAASGAEGASSAAAAAAAVGDAPPVGAVEEPGSPATVAFAAAAPRLAATVAISGPWRALCARLHSAGHLIDAAVRLALPRLCSPPLALAAGKGSHFPNQGPNVEYVGEVPAAQLPRFSQLLGEAVAELVARAAPTRVLLRRSRGALREELDAAGAAAEVEGMPVAALRALDLSHFPEGKAVRVVAVGGDDNVCPCGGTHVASAAELKGLQLGKITSKKGVTKVAYAVV